MKTTAQSLGRMAQAAAAILLLYVANTSPDVVAVVLCGSVAGVLLGLLV